MGGAGRLDVVSAPDGSRFIVDARCEFAGSSMLRESRTKGKWLVRVKPVRWSLRPAWQQRGLTEDEAMRLFDEVRSEVINGEWGSSGRHRRGRGA